MSTPYVGLNRVFQHEPQPTPWLADEPMSAESPADRYAQEAKQRLVQVLERMGVRTVQVGAFHMALAMAPTRHLLKAAHYLFGELKKEPTPAPHAELLEECLRTLLRSAE